MKRFMIMVFTGLLILVYFNCGGGSKDPKDVMMDLCDIFEEGLKDLEEAGTLGEGIAAFTKIGNKIKDMEVRILAVKQKYPDLKSILKGQVPPELGEVGERMKKINKEMMGRRLQLKVGGWNKYTKFRKFILEYQKILTIFD